MNRVQRRCFAGRAPGLRLPIGHGPAARLWTTSCGFEASETIPFPGADSIFKPLRRHFRAGRGPEPRVCGTGLPRGEILSAFSEFSMLCEAENFPPRSSATNSPIADEACRRRFASRGRWLSDGTCGNARPWRFPLVTKGSEQHTTILFLRKEKFENLEGGHPAKTRCCRKRGLIYIQVEDIAFAYICDNILWTKPLRGNAPLPDAMVRRGRRRSQGSILF
jgi:hypothetical protein